MSPTAHLSAEELVEDGFMRVPAAAKFLGVSRRHVYELMDRGELPYRRIGRARCIPRVALRTYAAADMVRSDRRAS